MICPGPDQCLPYSSFGYELELNPTIALCIERVSCRVNFYNMNKVEITKLYLYM